MAHRITFTDRQMDAFSLSIRQRFEQEMIDHLHAFAPPRCELAGREAVAKLVSLGIGRAHAWAFTKRGPVRLYLELLMLFGWGFDEDPLFPWARKILGSGTHANQLDRAKTLFERQRRCVAELMGPDRQAGGRALSRLRDRAASDVVLNEDGLEDQLVEMMFAVYPEKAEHAGETALRQLIRRMDRKAVDLFDGTPVTTEARALFAVLGFAGGCAFQDDPMLRPLIGRSLEDRGGRGPQDRVNRLRVRAIAYLEASLARTDLQT